MIGRGMTARTTAHLSANNDDTFKTMIDRRGEKLAQRLLCQSGRLDHPDRDDSVVEKPSIATFGALTESSSPGRRPSNRKSRRNTKPHKRQECQCTTLRVSRSRDTRARARYAIRTRRRSIRPSICRVSSAASNQRGGRLFSDTAVMSVEEEDGQRCRQDGGRTTIRAKSAVVATNSPINDRVRAAFEAGALPHLCDGAGNYRAASCRTRSTGTRSIRTTTCGSNPGKAFRLSHRRAAPTTRAVKRTMRRFATRRSKRDPQPPARVSAG